MRDFHQLAQNREFEFQFDAIYCRFQGRLVHVEIGVFNGNQGNIHQDTRQVDGKQIENDFAAVVLRIQLQHAIRFPDVEARNDYFLNAESRQLDLLHHVVPGHCRVGVVVIGHIGQHSRRNVQKEDVQHDQSQHQMKDPNISKHQV